VSRFPARAVIDLAAIRDNVRSLAAHAPTAQVMAVVKADAYGHGLVPVARAALAGGATWLGTAQVEEALALRAAGIVDYRREGTWVHYFISPNSHELIEKQLEFLTKEFGAERTLRSDHARVRKSCGPDVCK